MPLQNSSIVVYYSETKNQRTTQCEPTQLVTAHVVAQVPPPALDGLPLPKQPIALEITPVNLNQPVSRMGFAANTDVLMRCLHVCCLRGAARRVGELTARKLIM